MAKIKKKTFFHHRGKVHDLTIENSHTYNIEGKAVHNSAAGALVAYVLGITNLDPIEYGLPFERFLNPHRCLNPETLVQTPTGHKKIVDLKEGDLVIGGSGKPRKIKSKFASSSSRIYRFKVEKQTIECSPNHLWLIERDGQIIELQAKDILPSDKFLMR